MKTASPKVFSYFPGCSLATTAKENDRSMITALERLDIKLEALDDWNCCGSSSAHSVDPDLAFHLAARNLSLAPEGRPLLAACPSCLLRLKHAQHLVKSDPAKAWEYEEQWGRKPNRDLSIIHFLELFLQNDFQKRFKALEKPLKGLKFAPYYGCMLQRPPSLRHEPNYHGLLENVLSSLGAEPVNWSLGNRCCGTFLTVAKPEAVVPLVNGIMENAVKYGADCIVTACAMCHLNLEVRATGEYRPPVFHFSELLSMALGVKDYAAWFARHLIDPMPLLKEKGLAE